MRKRYDKALRLMPSDPTAKALSALTELMAALYLVRRYNAEAVVKQVLTLIHERGQFNEAELPELLKEAAYEVLGDEEKAEQVLTDLSVWISECQTEDLSGLAVWAAEYIKSPELI